MKIKRLYLTHFGKFQQFDLKPGPGLTIVYGPNEQGKTTLMAFIRLMLYGFAGRSQDISKNLRKKYQPWQGQTMQGFLEFEDNKRLYRLERKFGASNATDELALWDLHKNEQVPLPRDTDPGKLFLGLGAEAFEKSIYIAQAHVTIEGSGKQDEITQKLLNLVTTGEEDVSYQVVRDRLTAAAEKLVSKSGKKGKLALNRQHLEQLNQRKTQALHDEAEKQVLQQKIEQLKQARDQLLQDKKQLDEQIELEKIETEINQLKQVLRQRQALRDAEDRLNKLQKSLSQNSEQLNKEYEQVNKQLQQTNTSVTRLSDRVRKTSDQVAALRNESETMARQYEAAQRLFYQAQSQQASRQEQLEKVAASYDQRLTEAKQALAAAQLEQTAAREKQAEAKTASGIDFHGRHIASIIWLSAGLISLITSLLTGLLIRPELFVLAVISVPMFVLAWLNIKKATYRSNSPGDYLAEQNLSEQRQSITVLEQNRDYWQQERDMQVKLADEAVKTAQQQFKQAKTDFEKTSDLYNDLQASIDALQHQEKTEQAALETEKQLQAGLEGRYTRLKQEISQADSIYQAALKEQQDAAEAARHVQAQLSSDLSEQHESVIKQQLESLESKKQACKTTWVSSDYINPSQQLDKVEAQILLSGEQIAAEEAAAHEKYRARENVSQIEDAIAELELIIGRQTYQWQAVQIARQTLDAAFDDLQKSFGPLVNEKTAELFARLTSGKYHSVRVARDFSLAFETQTDGRLRQGEYLSGGTQDQVYLAMRLAIAELMADEDKPLPLLLDDVLTQFDDERATNALEMLKTYCLDKKHPVQVLLFTCHQRLVDWAEQNPEDVSLIMLNNSSFSSLQ